MRSGVLTVAGDQWPMFLYHGYKHDANSRDHWEGLFRSALLVKVCIFPTYFFTLTIESIFQAYKHVFTSPSSVEKEPKATRSGNARIHGMTSVTTASLAYIATQVGYRFALNFISLA